MSELLKFDRVRAHTAPYVNEEIDVESEGQIHHFTGKNRRDIINRITELEKEWDIDRALMANFAILGTLGLLAGIYRKKRWLAMPMVQLAFLMMHATYGWCPPVFLFRRLRFRTQKEIDREIYNLVELVKSPA